MFLTNFVGLAITGVNFLLEPSILQVFPQNSSPTSQPTSRLCLFACLLYTPWGVPPETSRQARCTCRPPRSSPWSLSRQHHHRGRGCASPLAKFFHFLFCELCIYVWTKIKPPRERCWRAGAAAFGSHRTDHSLRKGGQ
jgi:hypothetical protein